MNLVQLLLIFEFHNSLELTAPGCLGSRDPWSCSDRVLFAPAHGAFVVLCLGGVWEVAPLELGYVTRLFVLLSLNEMTRSSPTSFEKKSCRTLFIVMIDFD